MYKNEAIERLCKLVDDVATKVFANQQQGDCICGQNPHITHPVIDEAVVVFIERSIAIAIKNELEHFADYNDPCEDCEYNKGVNGCGATSCPPNIE